MIILTLIGGIFLVYAGQTLAEDCSDVPAIDLDRGRLNNSIYWTKQIFTTGNKTSFTTGFISDDQLVRTHLLFISPNVLGSSSLVRTTDNNSIMVIGIKNYIAEDETKAIFDPDMNIKLKHLNNEKDGVQPGPMNNMKRPMPKFALIYEELSGAFRIYQDCNKRMAWLQIRDSEMKHFQFGFNSQTLYYHDDMKEKIRELNLGDTSFIVPESTLPFPVDVSEINYSMLLGLN